MDAPPCDGGGTRDPTRRQGRDDQGAARGTGRSPSIADGASVFTIKRRSGGQPRRPPHLDRPDFSEGDASPGSSNKRRKMPKRPRPRDSSGTATTSVSAHGPLTLTA